MASTQTRASATWAQARSLTGLLPQPVRFGLRKAAFFGPTTRCALCGSRVRGLRSHGTNLEVLHHRQVVGGLRREADRCPVCHACDRTRLLLLYLQRHTPVGVEDVSLLHVAPEHGLYLWLRRQPGVRYVASDLDGRRYRHVPDFQPADLTDTPFADEQFDLVICSHVLEHIPDDRAAMSELHRILRPGGTALLLVPLATDGGATDEDPAVVAAEARTRRFGQWDHVRLYGREDFYDRLRRTGFNVQAYDPYADDPAAAAALHLNPTELLPVATKPRTGGQPEPLGERRAEPPRHSSRRAHT